MAQSQPVGQPAHVRVNNDPRVDPIRIPENHIGCFASDSRQSGQGFDRRRNLATMVDEDFSAGRLDVLRLVLVEPYTADGLGKSLGVSVRVVGWSAERLEELLGHLVDLLVGTLCREDCGHQQLKRIGKNELAVRIWIGRLQQSRDAFATTVSIGFGFSWHALR